MNAKYDQSRPPVPAELRREAEIEAGHKCSVAHCGEHTYIDLHHIDGNRENNQINNVIILCPKHHRMAERGEIDRKALREYKRINQERLGLHQSYKLPQIVLEKYLINLQNWLEAELNRIEKSPLEPNGKAINLAPILNTRGQASDNIPPLKKLDHQLQQNRRLLLLGNGGSGKTVTLLSWLKVIVEKAKLEETRIPVYIPLKTFTTKSDVISLIRASFGKNDVNIDTPQLENLLLQGIFLIAFDGLNEINQNAIGQGAIEDIANFSNQYSHNSFVISSRYIANVQDFDFVTVDMSAWGRQHIQNYLHLRLGNDLGEKTYQSLGSEPDFEWLNHSSVAGFCSNPLTLWMLATTVEKNGYPPEKEEDLVNTLLELIIRHSSNLHNDSLIPNTLIREIFGEFAYLMLARGEFLSLPYEEALRIAQEILQRRDLSMPLPKSFDSYDLLTTLTTTGLLRRVGDEIEWMHQILQERLSIEFSAKLFQKVTEATKSVLCPYCGYITDEFYEEDEKIFGVCEESGDEFEVTLPIIPHDQKLKRHVRFIDQTGLPSTNDSIAIPYSYFDEGYMRFLPFGGVLFMAALSFANKPQRQIERNDFEKYLKKPRPLFDLEIWALVEVGMFRLKHKSNLTTISISAPAVNPSGRHYEFRYITLREMSYEELEEDPDERIGLTTSEAEQRHEERRKRNLPIEQTYPFIEEDKNKVFRIAQKYGGQIRRAWGPYEEVIAEFPGEAWDFSKFASEDEFNEE